MASKKMPGYYTEQDKYQPGEELKDLLEEFYPPDRQNYLDIIDNDFRANGFIKDLFYESTILYLLRRLVTTTENIYRSNKEDRLKTVQLLKSYLQNNTRFSDHQVTRLSRLLMQCMDTARDGFSNGDKNFVQAQKKMYDWKCFVCGKVMDSSNIATADHFWPRAMGGLSNTGNLRIVCQICNNNHKRDYINYADFHYEEIAHSVTDYKHYQGSNPMRISEVAVFAKADYKCDVCGTEAYRVGELFIGRKDLDDGWHYANLTAYCFKHKPE